MNTKPTDLAPVEAARESQRRRAETLRAVGWLALGVAPEPQTVRQTIRYHVGHGLAMGYPLAEVLAFAWRNRRSFERSMDRPDEQALRNAWAEGYEWGRYHGPTASLIARLWRYAAFPLTRPTEPGVLFDPPLNDEELAVLNDAMSAYPSPSETA